MTMDEIKGKVESFVNTVLPQPLTLDYDTDIKDLGLNSIDLIKLLVYLETEYDIEFTDEDLLVDKDSVIIADIVNITKDKI